MRGSMFPTGIMPASVRRNPCRVNFLKSGKFKADSGGKPETGNHLSTVSTDIGGRSEDERDFIPMPGAGNHFLADEADIQQGHQG